VARNSTAYGSIAKVPSQLFVASTTTTVARTAVRVSHASCNAVAMKARSLGIPTSTNGRDVAA